MRWGEKETYQFVKIYLSHESLWNTEHPCYKLKTRRLKAYREVIEELKNVTGIILNEVELKMKIRNLKSTYSQELAKIKHRSNAEWTYKPSIKWFSEWHKCFYRRKTDEDSSFDSYQESQDHPSSEACPKIWVSPNDDDLEDETSDPFNEDQYNIILKSEPEDSHEPNPYLNKKKKIRNRNSSEYSEKYPSTIDSGSSKEDEFDIYGKYIATQLRSMDLQKALRVQLEIQSLVSEARLSELKQ